MDFADQIRELAAKLETKKDHVSTEEATKTAMVLPFLQVLGYDTSEPTEVIPEFNAAKGVKKSEKVDYVIVINKEPTILIEVKTARSILPSQCMEQLLRYFFGNTKSKFAILTNGIQYQFFSDLEQKNIMDEIPFLTVDLVPAIRDSEIAEIRKFQKEYFDFETISKGALELKYSGELKRYFKQQFKEPEDEFIKFLMKKTSFKRVATKQSLERFSPLVLNAFRKYVDEAVTDRSKAIFEEARRVEIGITKEEMEEKQILRLHFWTRLLDYAQKKTDLHAKISPHNGGWVSVTAGIKGLSFSYSVTKHQSGIELYIDKGKDCQEENKNIFDKLYSNKEEIEMSFGEPLEWLRLDDKRASRIRKMFNEGGYLDEGNWPKVHEAMVEAMIRLHKAISPHIQYLSK